MAENLDTVTSTDPQSPGKDELAPPTRPRRLSFRSLAFFYGRDKQPLPTPSDSPVPTTPVRIKFFSPLKSKSSRADKQALSSALALRALIVGPASVSPSSNEPSSPKAKRTQSKLSHPHLAPDLNKIKSHLLDPKTANAVIAQLRRLPLPDGPSLHASGNASAESLVVHPDAGGSPIHAVCLPCTDEEAHKLYFSRLRANHDDSSLQPGNKVSTSSPSALSIGTASLESLVSVLKDLHLVSLLTSPDLGFGQAVTEEDTGPLTGSVPSAGTIISGLEEITKQLMALGFATSKAVFPSHTGIYPPQDRMSVLTYWWGLELVMPEPSVKYLANVDSISHAVLNFLSAISLFANGVREVLPFIRYISNFVDFEWSAIKSQDKGKGVVCAATWVMPAAMVPRPWDFPPPPPSQPKASTTPAPTPTPAPDTSKAPQESFPALPLPMLPTLTVTPATLPRDVQPPQGKDST